MSRLIFLCVVLSVGLSHAAAPPALVEVEIARPIVRTVLRQKRYEARIEARESVKVRARVSGPVVRVLRRAGDAVKKGDLLFEIDARLARARLAKAEALLKKAKARLKRSSAAEKEEAEADVAITRAEADEAQVVVDMAQVRSPIDGRVRERLAGLDTVARADETVLAVVDSTGPVHAVFLVSEYDFVNNFRLIRSGKAPAGKEAANVQAGTGEKGDIPGKIVFVAGHLKGQPGRGHAEARAELPNDDGALVPGMAMSVWVYDSEPTKVAYTPGWHPSGGHIEWTTTPGWAAVVSSGSVVKFQSIRMDRRYRRSTRPGTDCCIRWRGCPRKTGLSSRRWG